MCFVGHAAVDVVFVGVVNLSRGEMQGREKCHYWGFSILY